MSNNGTAAAGLAATGVPLSLEQRIATHTARQRAWLQQELNYDGGDGGERVVHGLHVTETRVGLYGRTVVHLGRSSKNLPAHRLTTGDPVQIQSIKTKQTTAGVITAVSEEALVVALSSSRRKSDKNEDEESELGTPPLTIQAASDVQVHQTMVRALDELEQTTRQSPLIRALFSSSDTSSLTSRPVEEQSGDWHWYNPHLDKSQQQAIQFALASSASERPVACIHGPPGTGKTTVVVELIQQAIRLGSSSTGQKQRVLLAAPSNVAVDNVLQRLVQQKNKLKVVRLGHPARLQANILPYSLEALVQASPGTEIVKDVRAELQGFLSLLSSGKKVQDKRTAYREIKSLRAEIKKREQRVVHELLQTADVVLCTCVGAAQLGRLFKSPAKEQALPAFDWVVIDEAAQALEAACWIPILQASSSSTRLVLAGDPYQLPPTVRNPAVAAQLGQTLMERLLQEHDDVSRLLQVQYRMNHDIADWASKAIYQGRLTTHESVYHHTLASEQSDASGADDNEDEDDLTKTVLLLIDTTGCVMYEEVNEQGSRLNRGEADCVVKHVHALLATGLSPSDICVVTPYSGQVQLLKETFLLDGSSGECPVEVRTVDGFQGGERAAVVLSLVRSQPQGRHQSSSSIGFLQDDRRLNVAVTRAQKHLCVVCDSETVSQSPLLASLVDWMHEHGRVESALQHRQPYDAVLEGDLARAEQELERFEARESNNKAKPGSQREASRNKPPSVEDRMHPILNAIRHFAANGVPGGELALSSELSSADRRKVHELAEELGLQHVSDGLEGVDRRLVLSLPQSSDDTSETVVDMQGSDPTPGHGESADDEDVDDDEHDTKLGTTSAFVALQLDGDDEEDDDDGEDDNEVKSEVNGAKEDAVKTKPSAMNSLLGNLAKERAARQAPHQVPFQSAGAEKTKSKKKKKNGPKKPTSAQKPAPAVQAAEKSLDEMDDMAFLDAQIDMVQNSHGRQISGKGKNYRSIVNGVLLATPQGQGSKTDPRLAAALQSKLTQAQKDRKIKPKKKK